MRNNSDRIKPNLDSEDIATQVIQANNEQEQKNDVFNFAVPTEFVEMPSKGFFYPDSSPMNGVESLEVRYMTAKDEDILTSKSLLKQGIAIDRLIESILVNKRIKAKDMLSGDKNAILVASRISGFGEEYNTNISCPSCNSTVKYTFNLSEVKNRPLPDYESIGVTFSDKNTFFVTAPKTNAEIEMKLMTSKEETELLARMDKQEKSGIPLSPTTSYLHSIIVSVNGVENRSQIASFIERMPAQDSRFIRDIYSKINPSLDMSQMFVCPKCDHEQEVDIPITVDFFWSK